MRQLDRDLYCVDHPRGTHGMGLRTTAVRLPSGAVALHSPGPLSDGEAAELRALGTVRVLVAPNLLHHLYLAAALEKFPDARIVAPEGLAQKCPHLRIDGDPALLEGALVPVVVGGAPKLGEVAWIHGASRSLLLADLAFNIRPPAPLMVRMVMTLNGGWKRFGPTRIFRNFYLKDRAQLRASIDAILAHDFDRVVVTHGAVLDAGGAAELRQSFAWLTA